MIHSDSFSSHVRLLRKVHRLIAAGHGDEEQADRIRDKMDLTWRQLSATERDLVEGLSADLYSLGQDRTRPISDVETTQLQQAINGRSYQLVLDLLRAHAQELPPAVTAFLRGFCWDGLDQPELAIEFFLEAERLEKLVSYQEACLLRTFVRADKPLDGLHRAQGLASQADASAEVLLAAAEVFSMAAEVLEGQDVLPLVQLAIETTERGLAQAGHETNWIDDNQRFTALLHLALDQLRLGKLEAARQAYERARIIDPSSSNLRILHAWLTYESPPLAAADEFRRGLKGSIAENYHSPARPESLLRAAG